MRLAQEGREAGRLALLASFHWGLRQGRLFPARDQVKVCLQIREVSMSDDSSFALSEKAL